MPVITLQDQQFALRPGQTRLGGGASVDVRVSADDALGVQAIVDVGSDNQVAIRRAGDAAVVRVNGVLLGVEPTPLMHGDRIEISGKELLYADDRRAGATQFMSSDATLAAVQKRAGASRATAATGGRLVSLVDGKEYAISAHGASIGRDAACDVVVPDSQVSRHHAEIVATDDGYDVQDHSTNGVFVNGIRIQGTQRLARSDVLRVGGEEFRFYADVAAAAKPPVAATPVAPTPPSMPPSSTPRSVGEPAALKLEDRPALRATGAMPSMPKPQTPIPPARTSVQTSARARAWVWPLLIIIAAAVIAALYLRYR
jgi:FHA domain-containing protein